MSAEAKRQDFIDLLNWIGKECESFKNLQEEILDRPDIFTKNINFTALSSDIFKEAENLDKPFRLGVVGMFKAGKSTVLNTFLRRKVLKEGRTETTSVLTELQYAPSPEDEKGILIFKNDKTEVLSVDDALNYTDIRSPIFKDLADDEKRLLQENISKVALYLNCDFLQNMILLDTPGFGGSQSGDIQAAKALSNVDAALMIFAADKIGSEREEEISHFLSTNKREIVVLLNKIDDGKGNIRSEKSLEEVIQFIDKNFHTMVKDHNNNPLIFKYSAKEIWNALEIYMSDDLSEDKAKESSEALRRWGYFETGESEIEKGVQQFIRDRYFSSEADAMRKKLQQAQANISNKLLLILETIDINIQRLNKEKKENLIKLSEQQQKVESKVEPKIPVIEAKIEDIVSEQIFGFTQDMGEAIDMVIEKFGTLDIFSVAQAFKSKKRLADDAKEEFEIYFPNWRLDDLKEKIEIHVERLLQSEWRSLVSDIKKIDSRLESISTQKLLDGVSDVLRSLMAAIAGTISAMVALVFVPGGIIVDILWLLISSLVGINFSGKVDKKIALAKRKARMMVKNKGIELSRAIGKDARAVNDKIVGQVRDQLLSGKEDMEKRVKKLTETLEQWNHSKKLIENSHKHLNEIELM